MLSQVNPPTNKKCGAKSCLGSMKCLIFRRGEHGISDLHELFVQLRREQGSYVACCTFSAFVVLVTIFIFNFPLFQLKQGGEFVLLIN